MISTKNKSTVIFIAMSLNLQIKFEETDFINIESWHLYGAISTEEKWSFLEAFYILSRRGSFMVLFYIVSFSSFHVIFYLIYVHVYNFLKFLSTNSAISTLFLLINFSLGNGSVFLLSISSNFFVGCWTLCFTLFSVLKSIEFCPSRPYICGSAWSFWGLFLSFITMGRYTVSFILGFVYSYY